MERCSCIAHRCRNGFDDGVEQCRQVGVGCGHTDAFHGTTLASNRRDDFEVDVLVVGIEVDEQLIHLVEHFIGASVVTIDLVDDHDGRQVARQGFLQHVAGLRERALGGIDEQHHTVNHGESSLDLTTEVGVARRVDQVDLHTFPLHRRGLGENGDATLTLLVVRVHHAVDDCLVGGKGACGAQKRVNKRGLAMVDVRDQSDIAKGVHVLSGGVGRCTMQRLVEFVLVVEVVVVIVIERDAVFLCKGGVFVVLGGCCGTRTSETQVERARTSLLELARFFEAAVTTLLHDRAPGKVENRKLTNLTRCACRYTASLTRGSRTADTNNRSTTPSVCHSRTAAGEMGSDRGVVDGDEPQPTTPVEGERSAPFHQVADTFAQ